MRPGPLFGGWLLLAAAAGTCALPAQTAGRNRTEPIMTRAEGSFAVKIAPATTAVAEGVAAMSLEKTYTGELQAKGAGEMFSAGDPRSGHAGYVAIERVTGTLAGHAGSFALMQLATMSAGTPPAMTVVVAPGSGTGELTGISGTMEIVITGGQHRYVLEYRLP